MIAVCFKALSRNLGAEMRKTTKYDSKESRLQGKDFSSKPSGNEAGVPTSWPRLSVNSYFKKINWNRLTFENITTRCTRIPIQWPQGDPHEEVKRTKRQANHPLPSSSEVKYRQATSSFLKWWLSLFAILKVKIAWPFYEISKKVMHPVMNLLFKYCDPFAIFN